MTLANKITVFRFILIPVFVVLMYIEGDLFWFLAAVVFALAAISDKLDGYVAKKYNQTTDLGKIIDPLADKLLTFAAFCIFVDCDLMHPIALLIIIARELTITSMRVVVASGGNVVGAGWSGKLKTVIQMVSIIIILVMPLLPYIHIDLTEYEMITAQTLSWLIAAVTLISGIDYLMHGLSLKNLKK